MKLTTDSQIKKWKPKSDKGERASCGHGLYIQGFPNGTRAWIYRMLISEAGGKQKTVWLKIGYPASDTEHGVAGGPLRLHEARELSVRIGSIVKRGKASAAQIKNALEITCPMHEFEDMVAKPFVSPEVDFSKTHLSMSYSSSGMICKLSRSVGRTKHLSSAPLALTPITRNKHSVICPLQTSRGAWFLPPCKAYF